MTVAQLEDLLSKINNKELQIRTQVYNVVESEWLDRDPDEVLIVLDEYLNNYVLIV